MNQLPASVEDPSFFAWSVEQAVHPPTTDDQANPPTVRAESQLIGAGISEDRLAGAQVPKPRRGVKRRAGEHVAGMAKRQLIQPPLMPFEPPQGRAAFAIPEV